MDRGIMLKCLRVPVRADGRRYGNSARARNWHAARFDRWSKQIGRLQVPSNKDSTSIWCIVLEVAIFTDCWKL